MEIQIKCMNGMKWRWKMKTEIRHLKSNQPDKRSFFTFCFMQATVLRDVCFFFFLMKLRCHKQTLLLCLCNKQSYDLSLLRFNFVLNLFGLSLRFGDESPYRNISVILTRCYLEAQWMSLIHTSLYLYELYVIFDKNHMRTGYVLSKFLLAHSMQLYK